MSNYGSDRLALYTFESVFQFIRCWTNLKLVSSGPLELADKYFKMYPEEIDPVWGVSLLLFIYVCVCVCVCVSERESVSANRRPGKMGRKQKQLLFSVPTNSKSCSTMYIHIYQRTL